MTTLEELRATLPSYPIELTKPDIVRWKTSATGIDYVHSFDSGAPGPHVMINALTHGNEMCGAIALDALLNAGLQPNRGRLTFSFANVAAYEKFDLADPDATRYIDEDMNRIWATEVLDGPRDSAELRRARAMRPMIDTVDFFLDIHSMHEKAEPLILTGELPKGIEMGHRMAAKAHLMIDAGHASGRRLRDYAGFGDPDSPKNALLVECGQHFERASRDVALDTVCRFLLATGIVDELAVEPWTRLAKSIDAMSVRVTDAVVAETMDFRFVEDYRGMEVIAKEGTLVAAEGNREIRTPYDNCVLLQPSLRHLGKGVTVVRLGRLIKH